MIRAGSCLHRSAKAYGKRHYTVSTGLKVLDGLAPRYGAVAIVFRRAWACLETLVNSMETV